MNNFPKIALGTWLMGGTKDPDPNNDDEADIKKIITAVKSGVSLIDTAQNYADGKAEELVGEALKRLTRNERIKVKILTKHSRLKINSPEEIRLAVENSFRRLDVEAIDYYLLHAPAPDDNIIKLKYFFDVVAEFIEDGRIKNIGVSNFSIEMLEYAKKISKYPITVNQVSLNIFNRKAIEDGLLTYCLKNKIAVQCYRSLAELSSKIESNKFITDLAFRYKISNYQIVLAYLFSKGTDITVSASTQEHWSEIFHASNLSLRQSDIDYLEDNIKSEPNPRKEMDDFIELKLN
jgi:diketogulonate reductase-like aldo/keto reductase